MKRITTPEFRVSFPNVFQPRQNANGKMIHSIQMLIPKTSDMTDLKNILKEAINEKWPNSDSKPKNIINPIKDGDTDVMEDGTLRKDKYPEIAGHWFITASSVQRPSIVDRNMNYILNPEDFQAGYYAIATVHAFAYAPDKSSPTKKSGVAFGLNNIQMTRTGETFTGRTRPEDDFKPLSDKEFAGQMSLDEANSAEFLN